MNSHKISISLSQYQYKFIKNYRARHHYKSYSYVIQDALYLLQQAQLEACYGEANKEVDEAFNITNSDGLN